MCPCHTSLCMDCTSACALDGRACDGYSLHFGVETSLSTSKSAAQQVCIRTRAVSLWNLEMQSAPRNAPPHGFHTGPDLYLIRRIACTQRSTSGGGHLPVIVTWAGVCLHDCAACKQKVQRTWKKASPSTSNRLASTSPVASSSVSCMAYSQPPSPAPAGALTAVKQGMLQPSRVQPYVL